MLARAPRTVIGYHGCSIAAAGALLAGDVFLRSIWRGDWPGVGIYFWSISRLSLVRFDQGS
jgi:hypothetical protein